MKYFSQLAKAFPQYLELWGLRWAHVRVGLDVHQNLKYSNSADACQISVRNFDALRTTKAKGPRNAFRRKEPMTIQIERRANT